MNFCSHRRSVTPKSSYGHHQGKPEPRVQTIVVPRERLILVIFTFSLCFGSIYVLSRSIIYIVLQFGRLLNHGSKKVGRYFINVMDDLGTSYSADDF